MEGSNHERICDAVGEFDTQNLVSTVSQQANGFLLLCPCWLVYEQDYTKTSQQLLNFDGGRAPSQKSSRNIFSLSTEAKERHIF